jgi:simple sugar transport system permease protein
MLPANRAAQVVRSAAVPLVALALLAAFNLAATPDFFELELRDGRWVGAPIDVLVRGAPLALAALGMALVLGTGGVDLSVGSVAAIAGVVAGLGVRDAGLGAVPACAAGLAAGALAGLFNGALVSWLGLQPIVATLILFTAGRGVAQILSEGMVVSFQHPGFAALAAAHPFGVPLPVLIALAAAAVLGVVLAAGPRVFVEALGQSERAARLAGVPLGWTRAWAYALCGALAALAGLIVTADIQAADPANCGLYLELDSILAAVIGGTALAGGRVRLLGTLLGAFFLQALTTTILMHGLGYDSMLVIKAAAVLALAALQSPGLHARVKRLRNAEGRA